MMRICSLLPSATEILYTLGLEDSVVGVTHECDFPPAAATKPTLIRPRVDPQATPAEIDRQVQELVARGESVYSVDADLLDSLAPDLIITQDLCQVCAASPDDLATALTRFAHRPRVLTLTPHSLSDVWDDIRLVGEATGCSEVAERMAASLALRVTAIEKCSARARNRTRALCLEWLDPFYVGGHWVPEMVEKAGGEDVLGQSTKPSFRVTPEQLRQSGAEVVIVMQCGYSASRNAADFAATRVADAFTELPAFRERRIFAADANGYFSRPGPRLVEGIALLAHVFHSDLFPHEGVSAAMQLL
jgi:iron complex transport system substrate-binding protein